MKRSAKTNKKSGFKKGKKDLFLSVDTSRCPLDFSDPQKMLQSLIINSGMSLEDFNEKIWQKKYCHMQNKTGKSELTNIKGHLVKDGNHVSTDFSHYFKKLFSFEILHELAKKSILEEGQDICVSQVINNEKVCPSDFQISENQLKNFSKKGYTIQFHQPQRFHDELWKIQECLETYFSSLVGSNVYMTPGGTQGLAPHHDDVDVFVLQLSGSKEWNLYEPVEDFPLYCSKDLNVEDDNLVKCASVSMKPGDILYMPRGLVHEAKVSKGCEPSVHLTISTFQLNVWSKYLEEFLSEIRLSSIRSFRESLPVSRFSKSGAIQFKKEIAKRLDDVFAVTKKNLEQNQLSYLQDSTEDFFYERLPPFSSKEQLTDVKIPNLEDSIRFKYPNHAHLAIVSSERDDDEEEEDSDEEDESDQEDEEEKNGNLSEKVEENEIVLLFSINNNRKNHLVTSDAESVKNSIRLPCKNQNALIQILNNQKTFTSIKDLPLSSEDAITLITSLASEGLIEYEEKI